MTSHHVWRRVVVMGGPLGGPRNLELLEKKKGKKKLSTSNNDSKVLCAPVEMRATMGGGVRWRGGDLGARWSGNDIEVAGLG